MIPAEPKRRAACRGHSGECLLFVLSNHSHFKSSQFTYASNSPVPLFLTLRGTDVQALDLLVSASRLHLLRTVAIGSEAAEEDGLRRSNNTFVSSVVAGVFWPHDAPPEIGSGAGDPGVRVLRGEVFIPKGVKQSFAFPRFACRVSPFFWFPTLGV
jgi:hypothetical protein